MPRSYDQLVEQICEESGREGDSQRDQEFRRDVEEFLQSQGITPENRPGTEGQQNS